MLRKHKDTPELQLDSPTHSSSTSPLLGHETTTQRQYGTDDRLFQSSTPDMETEDDNRYPLPASRSGGALARDHSTISSMEASAAANYPKGRQGPIQQAYQALPPEYGSTSVAVGMTHRDTLRSRSRLRAITNGDLTSYWPGHMEVRRLFRLFDTNGDGLISSQELRSGLELLGFDVSHLSAVHNLQAELSDDRTGIIGEQNFIRAFRTLNRHTLQQKLTNTKEDSNETMKACQLTVIDMGEHLGKEQFSMRRSNMRRMNDLLDEAPKWDHHIRWIDVCGLHDIALQLLGSHLNLPKAVLEDVQLEQTSTYEYYEQTKMLKLVIHALHIHNFPCTVDAQGVSQLVSPSHYKKNRPSLEAVPIHIVIVDDQTVLTIRPSSTHVSFNRIWDEITGILNTSLPRTSNIANTSRSKGTSSSSSSAPTSTPSTTATSTSASSSDMPSSLPRISSIFSLYSAKSLAMDLVTEVADQNWMLRDMFKDWKIALGEKIREKSESYFLTHILDLDGISLLSVKILKPMSRMFSEITTAMGGTTLYTCHHQQKAAASFLSSIPEEVRSAAQSIHRLYEQAVFTTQVTKTLRDFYSQRNDEQMNRILYILTVVTTVVTPLQLSASVYGMNFENLPELHYHNAYYVFWIINIAIIATIAYWFKRQRYF